MFSTPLRFSALSLVLLLCLLSACRKGADPQIFADAGHALEEAEKAYVAKDFAKAAEHYATAMAGGGLNADAYCDAAVRRAECLIRTEHFPDAETILAELDQGATNPAQLHNVRAFLMKKQGKAPQASEQQRLAKQLDPTILPLTD
jgi:thioredoxin-like negative regulator of GroEL